MAINLLVYFEKFMTTVERFNFDDGSINARGVWEPGTESSGTISVSIPQPVTGKTLKMLPAGEDISDYVVVYVNGSENLKTRVDEKDADQLLIKGHRYEVHKMSDWSDYGEFSEYVLRRVQDV